MSFLFLVFLNTCVLATEHHNQPPWLDDFQVKYIWKNMSLHEFIFKSEMYISK